MPVKPGDIVELPEDAFKYGLGTVRLRVTRVRRDLIRYYEGEWVWLEGDEVRWDGSTTPRQLLARISALPGRTI